MQEEGNTIKIGGTHYAHIPAWALVGWERLDHYAFTVIRNDGKITIELSAPKKKGQ